MSTLEGSMQTPPSPVPIPEALRRYRLAEGMCPNGCGPMMNGDKSADEVMERRCQKCRFAVSTRKAAPDE